MVPKILSKRSLVFVFVAVGVLVGVSAQAVVMTREQKVWNSISKLKDVRSLVYDGSVSYYGKVSTKYSDLLSGFGAKKNPTKYQTFTLNFKGGKEIFTLVESQSWFSLLTKSSDAKDLVFGLETKSVGGNFYASINKADNFPVGLGEYKNLWVQLNAESILKEFGFGEALLERKALVQDVDEEEEKQVKELVAKSKTFKVVSAYASRSNGVLFDVYNFTVNKNELKKLVSDLMSLSGQPATARELADLNKSVAKIKSVSGNIWISRKDGMPYRLSVNIFGTQSREKTSINLNFKNFNQPVTVSEPASYINWKELFDKLFPGSSQFLNNTSTTTTVPAMW